MTARAFVRLDREGRVARITLDRPDRMNALSMQVCRELLETLDEVARDAGTAVVVLTGAERGFCAGGDVKEMVVNRDKTLEARHADLALMHRIPRRIALMPQTVIAAVNGPAYGAGFALALTADVVLAAEGASFGTAFLKQGLVSDFGLSYQLTRLAGPAAARRLILTDRRLSATEAARLCLVSTVHAPDRLLPEAMELAAGIADWPDDARAGIKTLLRQAETARLDEMLDAEADLQGRMIVSRAHAAAVDAVNAPERS